jgi:transcriptional regulator with XRE-family HTH domain
MNEETVLRRLGKRVKRGRLFKKLSQQQLGLVCGITTDYISKIENGKVNPTIRTLNKIVKDLKIRVADLFGDIS